MCDCLNELVKHATENKDIGSWDISSKMKEMNETFNERYTNLKSEKLCFQAKFAASGGRFSAALQYDLIHFNLGGECQQ